MKIEKKILYDYLRKVSIDTEVENCLLNFTEKGVLAKSVDRVQVITGEVKLPKELFVEYSPIGEVPIKNMGFIFMEVITT